MTTTFESAKAGDKVWSMQHGWGVVTYVWNCEAYAFPIDVYFQDGSSDSFTCGGKEYTENKYQSLFWDEVKIIAPKQPQHMKLIHGVEVPDISFTPKKEQHYYYPNARAPELFGDFPYSGDDIDTHLTLHNMCYPCTEKGKQAAILHAKAMLGIKE